MILGITGSQDGMNEQQQRSLIWLFNVLPITRFRHGDCIGVDKQAFELLKLIKPLAVTIAHPGFNPLDPDDDSKRAYTESDIIETPLPFLRRNRYIAGCVGGFKTDLLVVIPSLPYQIVRSGTWATYRYAKQVNTPRIILLP